MPLVSVVVPTHNRPQMLAEALASVRAQTFHDYEIIVVSNGESEEMSRASWIVACNAEARFVELTEGNVSAARNFGVAKARGEWIAFLDDDDLWLPEKLACQLAEAARTGADMVSCDYIEFDHLGAKPDKIQRPGKWGKPDAKTLSNMGWWAAPSAVIVRRSVLRSIRFDPAFPNAEDMDLWRRIAWRHRIHHMDGAVLARMRRSHPSLTRHRLKAVWYEILYFRKMYRDTPADLRAVLPPLRRMIHRVMCSVVRIYVADMWTGIPALRAVYGRWVGLRQALRPRTRLTQLRYRLRLRTRATAVIKALGWKRECVRSESPAR